MDSLEKKENEVISNSEIVEVTQKSVEQLEEITVKQPEETIVEQLEEIEQSEETVEQFEETTIGNIEEPVEEVVTVLLAEETPVCETQESEVENTEELPGVDYTLLSRGQLVEELKTLVEREVHAVRNEIEDIKQLFYKSLSAENDALKAEFVEQGNSPDDYVPIKDEQEETLKNLLSQYRAKKAAHTAQIEKEKETNLLQKQHILEQMKTLTENNEDVSSNIKEFKDLQQKWKTIGQVPATETSGLWKQYNVCQEAFWDLVKINNELREYDFRKNLETKTQLCEAAERLTNEADVVTAFRQLQQLHDEWREIGPVARDLREEIWNRFKGASTAINKKHADFFEIRRKSEDENLEAKIALCEKIEAFDCSTLTTFNDWTDAANTIMKWQAEWRTIGFTPRKNGQQIYDRYRKACDAFFAAKTEFFKDVKSEKSANLDKKKSLCGKAEALKDSTEWKETSEILIQLQKEWKTIGAIPKKYSDDLWKRFVGACDYFFEQKNKNTSSQRSEEGENLAKKKELIAKINTFQKTEDHNKSLAELRELIAQWNAIGFVPFREKDKVYKEYRAAVDKQFDALNLDSNNRRLDTFRSNLEDMASKGENKLYREREKMMRAYEHLKSEITTYENNIGFFTSSSKKGGGLIKEMEKKIQSLKEECSLLEEKIKLLEEKFS